MCIRVNENRVLLVTEDSLPYQKRVEGYPVRALDLATGAPVIEGVVIGGEQQANGWHYELMLASCETYVAGDGLRVVLVDELEEPVDCEQAVPPSPEPGPTPVPDPTAEPTPYPMPQPTTPTPEPTPDDPEPTLEPKAPDAFTANIEVAEFAQNSPNSRHLFSALFATYEVVITPSGK